MRGVFLLFLFLLFNQAQATEEFTVFEKDGRFGVKDAAGEVLVPAVHDQLGWSDGSTEIFENVIGFKQNGLWGLISVKNRQLTENKFYTIAPCERSYVKASVKGRFSNQLFYGLLKTNGDIQVSFNYSELEFRGKYLFATSFDQLQSNVGVINLDNKVVIPLEYDNISSQGNFLIASRKSQKKDVYFQFRQVAENLDSVRVDGGLLGYKQGKVGFINSEGLLLHDFQFKDILIQSGTASPIDFPNWEILQGDKVMLRKSCDSLTFINGVWLSYVNGVQHLELDTQTLTDYQVHDTVEDKFILKNSKTGKWSVWNRAGEQLIDGQDHIKSSGSYFLTRENSKWQIFNSFGSKISSLPFKKIQSAQDKFFIAKKEQCWGVVDFRGDTYITFKYDSIIATSQHYYAVKFLGKWGITDRHGNWKVNPEFEKVEIFENLIVAKKGDAYSYFNDGQFLFRSTFLIKERVENFLMIENEDGKVGLLKLNGQLEIYPQYDSIRKSGDYWVFQQGDSSSIHSQPNRQLVSFDEGFQDFGEVVGEFIPARKNGRWGFVDFEARLRISNRYEAVQPFKDGYAAIKLRGRWGFIDENEKLVIQPYYDEVFSFHGEITAVQSKNLWGLIDKEGNEVVELKWKSIKYTDRGNYIVFDESGPAGLVDATGSFVLRSQFDSIEDTDLGIIVRQGNFMGLLDYDGRQIYSMNHRSIRRENGFLMLAN